MHARYTVQQCWVNLAVAAAIYLLFGLAAQRHGGPHGGLEVVLGVLLGAAALVVLRSDTAEARLAGLAASGVASAVGAYLLVGKGTYLSGSVVSVICFFQLLASAPCAQIVGARQAALGAQPVPPAQPVAWPADQTTSYVGPPAPAYQPTLGTAPLPEAPTPPGPAKPPGTFDYFGTAQAPRPHDE